MDLSFHGTKLSWIADFRVFMFFHECSHITYYYNNIHYTPVLKDSNVKGLREES